MVNRGGSLNPSAYPDEKFELYSIPAHDRGGPELTAGSMIGSAKQIVQPGDVMVSKIIPHIRRARIVQPFTGRRQIASGEWIVFRSESVNPDYLRHFLLSDRFHAQFMNTVAGVGGSLVRARPAQVKNIPLPLPHLAEQQRIATILDHADTLRAKRGQTLAHLNALPQAIFHQMFGGEATTTTLGEAAEIQGGLQVSAKRGSLPLKAPYLRVANVHRGRLDLSEVKTIGCTQAEWDRTQLRGGDLLFVEGHANPLEVGRAAIWDEQVEDCIHQNHLIRARVDPSLLLPAFAVEWFNSASGASHFRRAGKTTSGLNTISATTVRTAPMPLPPLEAQRTFARRVDVTNGHRAKLTNALRRDDALFASLQTRAFKGEL